MLTPVSGRAGFATFAPFGGTRTRTENGDMGSPAEFSRLVGGLGTYFSAQYARIRGRRRPKMAIGAVRHSILVAAWHVLKHEKDYTDLGADYFLKREGDDAYKKRLVRQLERLGYTVELQELARPA